MSIADAASIPDVLVEAQYIASEYEQQMTPMTSDERIQFLTGALAGTIAANNNLVATVHRMREALAEHAQVLAGLVMKRTGGKA